MCYVYQYLDSDRTPFYIGKGSNNRKNHHLIEAKRRTLKELKGKPSYFVATIIKMLKEEKEPIIEIIKDNLTDDEAFKLEEELVSKYGRKSLDENGILTNRSIGGRGGRKYKMPQSAIDTLIERNKASKGKKKPGLSKWISENKEDHWSYKQKGTKRSEEAKKNMSDKQKELQLGKKIMTFRSPEGEIFKVENWREFLKDNNLTYNLIRTSSNPLNKGKITTGPNKGWYVIDQKYKNRKV